MIRAETPFYAQPILNSPYEYPGRHWELDENNRPTNRIVDTRWPSAYVSPIRQRLRVLQPNDPDSYYASRELVPGDMRRDLEKARIVITNYHAFQRRETLELSAGGRALLQGHGAPLRTRETDGQVLQRVMPELMGLKRVLVLNDEAHHCYREKPDESVEGELRGDDRREAKKNAEKARIWISGLEMVQRKLGIQRVVDLSATPFFLRGSGYAEGTLFPWTASDFSLVDAIECGIVKLPRVPVADNIPGAEMPIFRELWKHIGKEMPKKKRGQAAADPLRLPTKLLTALNALNGERFYELTQGRRIEGAHPEAMEGRWSTNGLTAGSIGDLDDGLCLDRDGERVSRSTVVSVVGPSGGMYEEPAGKHRYQYRKLMMYGPEHERRTNPDLTISSYAGLSGSGVWRKSAKDAGETTTEILLSGVIIEEERTKDVSRNSRPNVLVYHAGRSLFGLVETMFRWGISGGPWTDSDQDVARQIKR